MLLGHCVFPLPPPLWGRVGVGGRSLRNILSWRLRGLLTPHPSPAQMTESTGFHDRPAVGTDDPDMLRAARYHDDIRDERPLAVAGVDRHERLVLRYLVFETRGVQDVAGDGGRQWLAGEVDRFTRARGEDASTGERDYPDLTSP
jgi:hypothetical protein